MRKNTTEIYDVVPIFAVDENGKALITEEQYSWLCNYAMRMAERAQGLYRVERLEANTAIDCQELQKKNQRCREALSRLNAMHSERNRPYPTQYEDGFLDGLDTAIYVVKKALEDEK